MDRKTSHYTIIQIPFLRWKNRCTRWKKKTASVVTFNLDTWEFLHTRDVRLFAWFIVFNATFNNNSHMSWWSASLVAGPGVPGENHRTVASHWLSNNVVSRTSRQERTTLVVIVTDCKGSCNSNYHTITDTTLPEILVVVPYKKMYEYMNE